MTVTSRSELTARLPYLGRNGTQPVRLVGGATGSLSAERAAAVANVVFRLHDLPRSQHVRIPAIRITCRQQEDIDERPRE